MKRLSRRAFLEFLSPRAEETAVSVTAAGAPGCVPPASSSAVAPEAPPASAASGFSLEAFYAARGPQKLPPIAIRPSVLHHADELTQIGCPPPHAPPRVEDDPVYTALAAGRGLPVGNGDERRKA